jgi:hypothetical protein
MQGLQGYLDRIQVILKEKGVYRGEVAELLSEVLGIKISEDALRLEKGVLKLKVHPAIRQELVIHKTEVLEKLKEKGVFKLL